MIDHLSTYATDFAKTKAFYQAAFAPLGHSIQMEFVAEWNTEFPSQRMCAFGPSDQPVFWIIESRTSATPRHIAFSAQTHDEVAAFHAQALTHGGKDNGGPGLRPHYHPNYFGAFVLDPDGNNVEAVCHKPFSD